ncbi:MAG: winged helix DNA-binding protein [Hamadaea sp.]|nr:winged helix DNA-binding protein [Hamadaea sp.]
MSEADRSTGRLLWQVTNRWRTATDRALSPLGLTHAQYVLLASLFGLTMQGRSPSQRELADFAGLEPIYVSKLARTLEAAGLLTRADHPTDPRAFQLSLTESGADTVRRTLAIVHGLHDDLTAPIGGPGSAANRQLVATLTALLGPTPSRQEGRSGMTSTETARPPLTGQDIAEAHGAVSALLGLALDGSGTSPHEYIGMRAAGARGPWDGRAALAGFLADQPQLNLSGEAAAEVVDGLAARGLITDGEPVTLTEAGSEALTRLGAPIMRQASELFAGLDPDELRTAQRVLAELTTRAQRMQSGS